MYSEKVVHARRERVETAIKRQLRVHSVDYCQEMVERLADCRGEKDIEVRKPTDEEVKFIQNELYMTKLSFTYWAERYAWISNKGIGIRRMYPLLESQNLILSEAGRLEEETFFVELGREDGILILLLKARQLGGSTLAQAMLTHRVTTQDNINSLTASDVPESSGYIYGMFERILDNLPWWLKPKHTSRSTTFPQEIEFDGGSIVWTGAGKSVRGVQGKRGQLGRGKTIGCAHLSELSTWEDTEQINASLLPTMHPNPRLLAVFESTAKGRNNWWHRQWQSSVNKIGRFTPVFIPWYAEKNQYRKTPPVDWLAADTTVAHAKHCEKSGERWVHRKVELTRDQLYWYEETRKVFVAEDRLSDFFEEYAADPDSAFQFSGRSIFGTAILERIERQMRQPVSLLDVGPMREIQRAR